MKRAILVTVIGYIALTLASPSLSGWALGEGAGEIQTSSDDVNGDGQGSGGEAETGDVGPVPDTPSPVAGRKGNSLLQASSTSSATLNDIDVVRYETSSDYDNYIDGAISTAETGIVYTTDFGIASVIYISGFVGGDAIGWRFYRPDGSLDTSLNVSYDAKTKCWSNGYCGTFSALYWYGKARTEGDLPGTWTVEVLFNNNLVFTQTFEMVGYALETATSNEVEGLSETVAPEPLRVRVLDFDGTAGVADEPVLFELASSPKNSGSPGLLTQYMDIPDGTQSTTLYVNTDADGYAEAFLAFGSKEGDYVVEVKSWHSQACYYDRCQALEITAKAEKLVLAVTAMRASTVPLKDYPAQFFEASIQGGAVLESLSEPFGALPSGASIEVDVEAEPYLPPWDFEVEWSWTLDDSKKTTGKGVFVGSNGTLLLIPPGTPSEASDFGLHVAEIEFEFLPIVAKGSPKAISTQDVFLDMWLFFDRDDDYDSNGIPNWAQFWSELPGIQALETSSAMTAFLGYLGSTETTPYETVLYTNRNHSHVYGEGATIDYGLTYCGASDIWIGPFAKETNDVTGHSGIDTFAETIIHEHTHMVLHLDWWGPDCAVSPLLDTDGDLVRDSVEVATGALLVPPLSAEESLLQVDEETFPRAFELQWLSGQLASEDWAYPGSQTEDNTSTP